LANRKQFWYATDGVDNIGAQKAVDSSVDTIYRSPDQTVSGSYLEIKLERAYEITGLIIRDFERKFEVTEEDSYLEVSKSNFLKKHQKRLTENQ